MKRLTAIVALFFAMAGPRVVLADSMETEIQIAMAMANVNSPAPGRTDALLQTPARAVPVAQPFRGIERRESHQCPNCGQLVLVKSGRGPVVGSHTHTCPYCRVVWWHYDK